MPFIIRIQKIETTFVNDMFIEQIANIGDQKKFVSALTVPNFEALKKYVEKNKIHFESIEDLINNTHIIEMFKKRFDELQKNFSGFEKIKKFKLLPKEFSYLISLFFKSFYSSFTLVSN